MKTVRKEERNPLYDAGCQLIDTLHGLEEVGQKDFPILAVNAMTYEEFNQNQLDKAKSLSNETFNACLKFNEKIYEQRSI